MNRAESVLPQKFLFSLPQSWRDYLRRFEADAIEREMSGARLFHLRGEAGAELYLKIGEGRESSELRNEVERTRWLAQHGVRVPNIRHVFDDGSLSAALMTALPGHHPDEMRRPVTDVAHDLAEALGALHSLPAVECPFDETVNARLDRARRLIKDGSVSAEYFDDRNQGLAPEVIYNRLIGAIPRHEDLVIVHGDATFDNLLVDDDGEVGFVDCGHAGRGDRYLDLVTILADFEEYFGAEGVNEFLNSYGVSELDAGKLDFFRDLYELF
jgi:aminoglycoside 3'-phosphotransferase II